MAQAGQKFQKIRRRHKLLGLMRLFRIPNLLLILLGQVLVIWQFPIDENGWTLLHGPSLILAILASQASAAAGYILNDYHDVKIDIVNKPGRVVVGRLVTRRKALFAYFILTSLAIGAGFLAGKKAGLLVLLCCFLLWLYSARLKCIPLLGNLVVALLVSLSLFLPTLFFDAKQEAVLFFCLFAFLSNLIRELVKDMEDMRGDRQHDCKTFPLSFGIPASRKLINILGLLLFCLLLLAFVRFSIGWKLFLIFLLFPFGMFFVRLQKADRKMHFTRLSRLLKWAMLAGTLGMLGV
jgi:4-hydroxybenzoate polyprenyltransferase